MPVLTADVVPGLVAGGASTRVDEPVKPKFKVEDRIVVRNLHPANHTRSPRYTRGKHGVIDRDHGVFVLPDTNAHGGGPSPQHVYSVRFDARELWGPDASPKVILYMDVWDDYMDPA